MYVDAPRYLLRKYAALKLLKNIPEGKALDVGCGAGDMCETLYHQGFTVKGIDYSEDAIALCHYRLKDLLESKKILFTNEKIDQISETFDLIIMMEVLEHIEDDAKALEKIHELLNPGGHLIISVPAHKKNFGPSDEHVGHYRRYDKKEFIQLLQSYNLTVLKLWSYGVPLANMTEQIRNMIFAKASNKGKEEMTKQSGIDRKLESRFKFLLNNFFLYPFYLLQMFFVSTELGTGYIVKCVKNNS